MDYPLSQATELDLYLGKFTDGEPGVRPASIIPAGTTNAVIDEILAVIGAAGMTPNETSFTQLRDAILSLIEIRTSNYAVDTGVVDNAYVIALNPAITAYTEGLSVRFRTTRANSGACTIDAGAGAVPLKREDNVALVDGDIGYGYITLATYVESAGAFFVNEIVSSQIKTGDIYVNSAGVLSAGSYLVDTKAGPFTIKFPANPSGNPAITLADARAKWGTNPVTIDFQGKNFAVLDGPAQAGPLVCNVSDQKFTSWWDASANLWRLM